MSEREGEMIERWKEREGEREGEVLTLCQRERHVHRVRGRPAYVGGGED